MIIVLSAFGLQGIAAFPRKDARLRPGMHTHDKWGPPDGRL
jgi:hypothetical protein